MAQAPSFSCWRIHGAQAINTENDLHAGMMCKRGEINEKFKYRFFSLRPEDPFAVLVWYEVCEANTALALVFHQLNFFSHEPDKAKLGRGIG